MRLCRVKGAKAIFHSWSEAADVIPPASMIGGHEGGVVQFATAIVEYENGQVAVVMADKVVFEDTAEVMKGLEVPENKPNPLT